MRFLGNSPVTLDSKGRLAVPTKYREALIAGCEGKMMMTLGKGHHALLLPMPVWDDLDAQVSRLPSSDPTRARVLMNAEPVEMDGGGRILVPASLRERGLFPNPRLAFAANGSHFQIWDWDALVASDAANQAAAEAGFERMVF